jgi:signal transduction histidine kinase/DNA-binding response OmpR family regulator
MTKSIQETWRILLIDDDEDDYSLTDYMLALARGQKVELEWASTYEQGREELLRNAYHAVLVDYDLGDRTGIELIREMSSQDYPVPLILYTGRGSFDVDMEAMEAGATLYLTKNEANPLLLERFIRYAIERKQQEVALQKSGRLDAYRLALSDALRPLQDPDEIQGAAARILGEHLQASRVFYGEIDGEFIHVAADFCRQVSSFVGRHRLDDFNSILMNRLRRGDPCIVPDVEAEDISKEELHTYQEAEVSAYAGLPLLKEGRIAAVLAVHQDHQRAWTDAEIGLIEETAERTWAAVERARAEQARRSSEDRYGVMMDSIDEGFCVVQMVFDEKNKPVDYYILENNRAFENLTGLIDAQGKSVRYMSPDLEEHWYQTYGRVALTREAVRFENFSKPMGRWFSVYAFPVGEPQENKVGILFTNITDRKNIEAELAAHTRQLQESNQALRDFAFMASHDMREPLRKVQAFSDQLISEAGELLNEKQLDYLERIRQANQRMKSMLDALLDYSKVSAQGEPFKGTDLNKVVADVCQDLEVLLNDTGGSIEIEALPVIQADPGQMRQLMQNLISNALKYHKPQTPPLVKVYCRSSENNHIELVVEDNGIGFALKDAEQIFKPFHRLVRRSEYQGTGIGLAICHKIVKRHGGRISAESQLGEGARFVVILPG